MSEEIKKAGRGLTVEEVHKIVEDNYSFFVEMDIKDESAMCTLMSLIQDAVALEPEKATEIADKWCGHVRAWVRDFTDKRKKKENKGE